LAANVYEGLYILDSNRYGRDPETVSSQVAAMIEKIGGEILVSRLWEDRRLAFPIKGHRKGTYWLTYFRLDSTKLVDLKRQCQITEDVIRVLFLKVDPRIVDALVTHARSAPLVVAAPSEEAKPVVEGLDEELPIVDALEGEVIEVDDDK
jgi:small subunit ribosomal protein S6